MKDEEKAEEYYEKNRIINCMPYDDKESYIKAYLDGLSDGRKESCEVCEKSSMKEYQKLFDKEYKIIEELEQKNAKLKAQIDQLSNDNHVLKTSFITQQEQIGNLEEDKGQIIFESDLKIKALEEMMKCCGNCKNSIITDDWNVKCPISDLDTWDNYKCKNWKLAE